jgi:hypothetical protein
MSCSLWAANIKTPRSVPYPVPADSRCVRSRSPSGAVRVRSVHSPYECPRGRRSTAGPLVFRHRRNPTLYRTALPRRQGPCLWTAGSGGPDRLLRLRTVARPAPAATCPSPVDRAAAWRSTALWTVMRPTPAPSSGGSDSSAGAVTGARKTSRAPGSGVSSAATAPPVTDSATMSVPLLTVSGRTRSVAAELTLRTPPTPPRARRFPGV